MLSKLPDLAIEFVLGPYSAADDKAEKVLRMIGKGVKSHHPELLERMLSSPTLAPLVPHVFATCFDTFPVEALQRCVDSMHIDQEILLLRLAASSNPLHMSVHRSLIQQTLRRPINLLLYRQLASVLRAHTRHDAIELLKTTLALGEDNAIWFAREVENARGERLLDERLQCRA
jgi:hypothetical protein